MTSNEVTFAQADRAVSLLSIAQNIALGELAQRGGTACNRPTLVQLYELGLIVVVPPRREPGQEYRPTLTPLGRAVVARLDVHLKRKRHAVAGPDSRRAGASLANRAQDG